MVELVGSYNRKLQQSEKLLFYATPGGLVRAPMVEWCKSNLKHLKTIDLGQGIHFLQEDHPHRIGEEIAKWYKGL